MLHGNEIWPVRRENEMALQQGDENGQMDVCKTAHDGIDMRCEKKTVIGRRNVWSMKWKVPDPKVDHRGLGERLCKMSVKHIS